MTGVLGTRLQTRHVFVILLIASWTLAVPARAELLVYEPFDYPVGSPLLGANGGTGFTSPWRTETTAGTASILSGSISYPGLPVAGNRVLMSGETGTYNIWRDFLNVEGADGTTTWLSFLGQRLGPETAAANPYPRGVNVSFYNTEDDDPNTTERFAVGNSSNAPTNNWAFIGRGSLTNILPATDPPAPYGGAPPAFVVIRIDHHGPPNVNGGDNNDDVYFFVNPDPLTEPLTSAANAQRLGTEPSAFDYSGLDHVRPFIGGTSGSSPYGELLWDELRIGTTYGDVTGGDSTPIFPGDTDGDGTPGEFPDDFEPIRANFRKAVTARNQGDLVPNGVVDFDDFRQWKTAHLAGGGTLAGIDFGFLSNVPEPASGIIVLLASAFTASATTRRGRRR